MGLIFIIILAALGGAFLAGGIVGYRKSKATWAKVISAAAIAAGAIMLAIILLVFPVSQQIG